MAAAHLLPQLIGIPPIDARSIAILVWTPQAAINLITPCTLIRPGGEAFNEAYQCPTNGVCPEKPVFQCAIYCANAIVSELNPFFEIRLLKSQGVRGDPFCRWVVREERKQHDRIFR